MKKIFLTLIICLFSVGTVTAVNLPEGIQEQISVKFSNSTPGANEIVSVSVASYSSDLNKETISWYLNGELEIREIGATNFTFTTGQNGETTRLGLIIEKRDGNIIERSYSFNPSEVDLIYESVTKTHPFYSGKALFSNQAESKIVAIPWLRDANGNLIPSEQLVYTWKKDGRVDQDRSGYGKDMFYYNGSIITRPFNLSVTVSDTNSTTVAKNSINMTAIRPEIVFYENNPLYGTIFERAITGDFVLEREEVEFKSVPYYFDSNRYIDYEWKLNSSTIETPYNQDYMIFRNVNNETGQAKIQLDIKNYEKILQAASVSFNIFFGENVQDFF